MKTILCFIIVSAIALAAEPSSLDRPLQQLRFEKAPLPAALRTLARVCRTTILVDPDVAGDITIELQAVTLRSALTALTAPAGYYFEETSAGVCVHRAKT